jgi:hypothetical protein
MTQLSKVDAHIINIDDLLNYNVLHDDFECLIQFYDVYINTHIL